MQCVSIINCLHKICLVPSIKIMFYKGWKLIFCLRGSSPPPFHSRSRFVMNMRMHALKYLQILVFLWWDFDKPLSTYCSDKIYWMNLNCEKIKACMFKGLDFSVFMVVCTILATNKYMYKHKQVCTKESLSR